MGKDKFKEDVMKNMDEKKHSEKLNQHTYKKLKIMYSLLKTDLRKNRKKLLFVLGMHLFLPF